MATLEKDLQNKVSSNVTGMEKKEISEQLQKPKGPALLQRIKRTNGIESEIYLTSRTLSPELVDDETVATILHLLKTEKNCTSFSLSSKAIASPIHQRLILEAITQCRTIVNLRLYSLKDIPNKLLQSIVQLPLISLMLFECSLLEKDPTSENLAQLIAQSKNLQSATLVRLGLENSALKVLMAMPKLERLLLEEQQLSSTCLETLLNGKSCRSLEIFVDDATPISSVSEGVKTALRQNNVLIHVKSNHVVLEMPEIQDILHKILDANRNTTLPSKKVSYITDEARKIITGNHLYPGLYGAIWKILDTKDIQQIKMMMSETGFNPNCFTDDHGDFSRNPLLNVLVANEVHHPLVILLLEAFTGLINPNEYDFEWKNLLIIAAKIYSADAVLLKILQCYGKTIDLDARDTKGCTALHYVCAFGKVALAEAILKLNPNLIHAKDNQGNTCLDYACMPKEKVEEILKPDIDPERDANATMSHLMSFLGTLSNPILVAQETKDGLNAYEISSTLSNLNKLQPYLNPHNSEAQNELDRKQFLETQNNLRKHFCGKSVIEVCMAGKQDVKDFLEKEILNMKTKEAFSVGGTYMNTYTPSPFSESFSDSESFPEAGVIISSKAASTKNKVGT